MEFIKCRKSVNPNLRGVIYEQPLTCSHRLANMTSPDHFPLDAEQFSASFLNCPQFQTLPSRKEHYRADQTPQQRFGSRTRMVWGAHRANRWTVNWRDKSGLCRQVCSRKWKGFSFHTVHKWCHTSLENFGFPLPSVTLKYKFYLEPHRKWHKIVNPSQP